MTGAYRLGTSRTPSYLRQCEFIFAWFLPLSLSLLVISKYISVSIQITHGSNESLCDRVLFHVVLSLSSHYSEIPPTEGITTPVGNDEPHLQTRVIYATRFRNVSGPFASMYAVSAVKPIDN